MVTINMTNAVHRQMNQFRALVQRYHADPDYRRQVETDPVAALREQGMELPSDIAVRVLANTDDTFYMVIPPDPNADLSDEMLAAVAGGSDTMSTASCPASTASTLHSSLHIGG